MSRNKEHQVKYWKEHKPHCKQRQLCHQQTKELNAHYDSYNKEHGLPSIMERRQIIEDWCEVHRHMIEQALVHAIYTRRPKVDLQRDFALFLLTYQPESNCNPSTAFKLHGAEIGPDPRDSVYGPAHRSFRETMVAQDALMRREDAGYIGAFLTVYQYDGQSTWMTCTYLNAYTHDIPKFPRTMPVERYEEEWYQVLKFFTDKGVMFRAVGPTVQYWLPGTMERSRNRFLWRKRTMEELKGMGIEFTCTLRRGADVRRIELRAPWLMGAVIFLDLQKQRVPRTKFAKLLQKTVD
ncbi:hypothetical protein HWV62_9861 [Athelia sp. TMB]|nr:hypothetical protein HWV62_9861 [Athelia sp. TMB]